MQKDIKRDRHRLLGHLLVEHLRDQTQKENLPAVFHRANALFTQVTNGKFELKFDPRDKVFSALDTHNSRTRTLDELSDGTRLQLHICVRVAFIESQEQGLALPLLLDEILANSDDERAERLVDVFVTLQKTGRQIFYFTAQYDEILKWQRIAEKRGLKKPPVFRMETALAAARDPFTGLLDQSTPAPSVNDIPDPAGLTHAEFGKKIGVPSFNPRSGIGSLHLWYLTKDENVLATLLRSNHSTWGQIKSLHDAGIDLPLAEDAWNRLEARAQLMQEALSLWAQGRGRPVTMEILEKSGVTDAFWDRVQDIAIKVDWDAAKIITGTDRLKRRKPEMIDSMWEKFLEEGCLDEDDPLSEDDIRAQLLPIFKSEQNADLLTLEDFDWTVDVIHFGIK